MGIVQLDTVKAGLLDPSRRIGKQARQHPWQFAYMRQMHIRDTFAIPPGEVLILTFTQNLL